MKTSVIYDLIFSMNREEAKAALKDFTPNDLLHFLENLEMTDVRSSYLRCFYLMLLRENFTPTELSKLTNIHPNTITNYVRVAKMYEPSEIYMDVCFGVYMRATATPEPMYWVNHVRANHWSLNQMVDAIQAYRDNPSAILAQSGSQESKGSAAAVSGKDLAATIDPLMAIQHLLTRKKEIPQLKKAVKAELDRLYSDLKVIEDKASKIYTVLTA